MRRRSPEALQKSDPRKLTFGFRIEKEQVQSFWWYRRLNPEKVRLSNGLTVKLLGIKSEPFTYDKVIGYLTEKIKGKRIFLKYEKLKLHEENRLLCYLYLESKTFVNEHLIKAVWLELTAVMSTSRSPYVGT